MSDRSLRPLELLDYKILNKSGGRVYKGTREVGIMSTQKLQDSERKLSRKISRFWEENKISEFFDLNEIESAAGFLRELLESFEDVHIELSRELGNEDYSKEYEKYDQTIKKISDWLKDSKAEIRRRKSQVLEKDKDKLRVEEEFFRSRISRDLGSLDLEDTKFIEDLERHTYVAKELLKSYSDIFLRIKEQGEAFAKELQGVYDTQIKDLEEFIQKRRKTILEIKVAEKEADSERRKSEEQKKSEEKKIRDEEAISVCETIHENICERMKKLEIKC